MSARGVLAAVLLAAWVAPAAGQASLDRIVRRASDAWLGHRTRELVEASDTVRLRIPGFAAATAVRSGQAARLLDEYLADAEELGFELQGVRQVGAGQAYAEFSRRFQVRGTAEERVESVFFGYRVVGGVWRLQEVRIVP